MILYHGSNMEISEIDLSKSKPFKDFGRAFYLSANRRQAVEMAQYKSNIIQIPFKNYPTIRQDFISKVPIMYSLIWTMKSKMAN